MSKYVIDGLVCGQDKPVSRSWDSGLCNLGLQSPGGLSHGAFAAISPGHTATLNGRAGHGTIGSYKKIYWTTGTPAKSGNTLGMGIGLPWHYPAKFGLVYHKV